MYPPDTIINLGDYNQNNQEDESYSFGDSAGSLYSECESSKFSPLVKAKPFSTLNSMVNSINGTVRDENNLCEENDALYFRRLYNREKEKKILYYIHRYPEATNNDENPKDDKHTYINTMNSKGKRRSDVAPQQVEYLRLKGLTTNKNYYFRVFNENDLPFTRDTKFQKLIIEHQRDIDDNTDESDIENASIEIINQCDEAILLYKTKLLKIDD